MGLYNSIDAGGKKLEGDIPAKVKGSEFIQLVMPRNSGARPPVCPPGKQAVTKMALKAVAITAMASVSRTLIMGFPLANSASPFSTRNSAGPVPPQSQSEIPV